MKKVEQVKSAVTEAAERIYDLVKDNHYDVSVNVMNKDRKKGMTIQRNRPTRHTIKWRAKNH
ncbi:hypothetical protein [Enterococcus sp. CSURQ0835]|uniref:hypothetical protein n=1 Tax=Enterococcus sp. CSURQ0835 TaxID=2681394 RepID=UPI001358EF0C|nr:hypothetical protein [Enterococcus sp. CSURQ0835]